MAPVRWWLLYLQKYFKCSSLQQPSICPGQQQKQPIDILFLLSNYWLDTVFLIAMHTFRQFWIHQILWCPIMHVVHVCNQISRDYIKFCLQIERHLELCSATLALNVTSPVILKILFCKRWFRLWIFARRSVSHMKVIGIGPLRGAARSCDGRMIRVDILRLRRTWYLWR